MELGTSGSADVMQRMSSPKQRQQTQTQSLPSHLTCTQGEDTSRAGTAGPREGLSTPKLSAVRGCSSVPQWRLSECASTPQHQHQQRQQQQQSRQPSAADASDEGRASNTVATTPRVTSAVAVGSQRALAATGVPSLALPYPKSILTAGKISGRHQHELHEASSGASYDLTGSLRRPTPAASAPSIAATFRHRTHANTAHQCGGGSVGDGAVTSSAALSSSPHVVVRGAPSTPSPSSSSSVAVVANGAAGGSSSSSTVPQLEQHHPTSRFRALAGPRYGEGGGRLLRDGHSSMRSASGRCVRVLSPSSPARVAEVSCAAAAAAPPRHLPPSLTPSPTGAAAAAADETAAAPAPAAVSASLLRAEVTASSSSNAVSSSFPPTPGSSAATPPLPTPSRCCTSPVRVAPQSPASPASYFSSSAAESLTPSAAEFYLGFGYGDFLSRPRETAEVVTDSPPPTPAGEPLPEVTPAPALTLARVIPPVPPQPAPDAPRQHERAAASIAPVSTAATSSSSRGPPLRRANATLRPDAGRQGRVVLPPPPPGNEATHARGPTTTAAPATATTTTTTAAAGQGKAASFSSVENLYYYTQFLMSGPSSTPATPPDAQRRPASTSAAAGQSSSYISADDADVVANASTRVALNRHPPSPPPVEQLSRVPSSSFHYGLLQQLSGSSSTAAGATALAAHPPPSGAAPTSMTATRRGSGASAGAAAAAAAGGGGSGGTRLARVASLHSIGGESVVSAFSLAPSTDSEWVAGSVFHGIDDDADSDTDGGAIETGRPARDAEGRQSCGSSVLPRPGSSASHSDMCKWRGSSSSSSSGSSSSSSSSSRRGDVVAPGGGQPPALVCGRLTKATRVGGRCRALPMERFHDYYVLEAVIREEQGRVTYRVRERGTRSRYAATFVLHDRQRGGGGDGEAHMPAMSDDAKRRCAVSLLLEHPNLLRTFDFFYSRAEDATGVRELMRASTSASGGAWTAEATPTSGSATTMPPAQTPILVTCSHSGVLRAPQPARHRTSANTGSAALLPTPTSQKEKSSAASHPGRRPSPHRSPQTSATSSGSGGGGGGTPHFVRRLFPSLFSPAAASTPTPPTTAKAPPPLLPDSLLKAGGGQRDERSDGVDVGAGLAQRRPTRSAGCVEAREGDRDRARHGRSGKRVVVVCTDAVTAPPPHRVAAVLISEHVEAVSPLLEEARRRGGLPMPVLVDTTRAVASALRYLHSFGTPHMSLIHGSVSPGSIAVDASGTVRLVNYSALRWWLREAHPAQAPVRCGRRDGTHRTPRVQPCPPSSSPLLETSTDLYDLGGTLLTLLCGLPLAQARSLFYAGSLTAPTEHMQSLLLGLLERRPERRLTAEAVLRHPFLQSATSLPRSPAGAISAARLQHSSDRGTAVLPPPRPPAHHARHGDSHSSSSDDASLSLPETHLVSWWSGLRSL
ncbi:hypothetical protein NESM_000091000 [Novymonas esmeraldas]|uniref:Protein kinase domain-containing protein n=1 Tax=Novymonas esmeraldas TaxID=1808958 RepID=A0AAW0F2L7_9TRYP